MNEEPQVWEEAPGQDSFWGSQMPRMDARDAGQLNPLQLAYLGDAVWEMIIRSRLVQRRLNVHHMHSECVKQVNAAAQARAAERIIPLLMEEEAAIYQRGRNAHAKHPSPRHQDPGDYSEATGFEALMGYLYLTGRSGRIRELEKAIFQMEQG